MLFITKTGEKGGKGGGRGHPKKFSTYGKSQREVAQTQIEQYLEEQCDWEEIHFTITDSNQEATSALYDHKKLAQMLAKDEYFDWASALGSVEPLLLDYIQKSLKVDKAKGEVTLHNAEHVEQNILQKFRKTVGGKYLIRGDLDLSADEQKIVTKQLMTNTEVEMCEFLYDIKIFKI